VFVVIVGAGVVVIVNTTWFEFAVAVFESMTLQEKM
jgi:hypothetical protein